MLVCDTSAAVAQGLHVERNWADRKIPSSNSCYLVARMLLVVMLGAPSSVLAPSSTGAPSSFLLRIQARMHFLLGSLKRGVLAVPCFPAAKNTSLRFELRFIQRHQTALCEL